MVPYTGILRQRCLARNLGPRRRRRANEPGHSQRRSADVANGALGILEATTAAYPGYLKRIEILGSEGSAVLEEEDLKAWDFAKPRKEDKAILEQMKAHKSSGGGASDPAAIGHHGHTMQFR